MIYESGIQYGLGIKKVLQYEEIVHKHIVIFGYIDGARLKIPGSGFLPDMIAF